MNLFGPSILLSFGENYYALVIVGDFSRYTWTLFISKKKNFWSLSKIGLNYKKRSEHFIYPKQSWMWISKWGFWKYLQRKWYCPHVFAQNLQQNEVMETKKLIFWRSSEDEKILDKTYLKLTPYEIYKGGNLNASHLFIFWCTCFFQNNRRGVWHVTFL